MRDALASAVGGFAVFGLLVFAHALWRLLRLVRARRLVIQQGAERERRVTAEAEIQRRAIEEREHIRALMTPTPRAPDGTPLFRCALSVESLIAASGALQGRNKP